MGAALTRPATMTLDRLFAAAGIMPPSSGSGGLMPALVLSGIALDSRRVTPGSLFMAVSGSRDDGKAHVADAVQRGAVAVLADAPVMAEVPVLVLPTLRHQLGALAAAFFGQPSVAMAVTGVTGTNGKTTVTRIIAQLLRASGQHCGVLGTLGAVLDDSVAETLNTTPDAVALQAQLAAWRDSGVDAVAMEVSSHALEQGRIQGLRLHSAIFTNLSRDHLDYHGDMQAYGAAKAKLFAQAGLRHAIINIDDVFGAQLAAQLPRSLSMLRCSISATDVEVTVRDIEYASDGIRCLLVTPWGEARLHSVLRGDFNLNNLVLACAGALRHGVPLASLPAAVARVTAVPGRMQVLAEQPVQVVVDYAHTPAALELSLRALRRHVSGRLICVFGCGGDRDPGKRPLMGEVAGRVADTVVLTSDNPRSEDPQQIIAAIAAGCKVAAAVETDRAHAIRHAITLARPGDCVLIAGKGHETVQVIGDQRVPFSDIDHARAALTAEYPS